MKFPVIITNFKTYTTASGEAALRLAELHEEVGGKAGVHFVCAVSSLDIVPVAASVSVPVFAQHIDDCEPGKNTGFLTAEAVKAAGATGTLLNHAEHQISIEKIISTMKRAEAVGLEVVVCASDAENAGAIADACRKASLKPTAIAVEPPDLIGGDISITTASPNIITDAVASVGDIPLLVGAGVKTGKDVRKALELGARGVLLASGVAAASNPEAVLLDLASK